jgi:hypothetical protein
MRQLFIKSLSLKILQRDSTILMEDMLVTKKPGVGIRTREIPQCIGRTLQQDIPSLPIDYYDGKILNERCH